MGGLSGEAHLSGAAAEIGRLPREQQADESAGGYCAPEPPS